MKVGDLVKYRNRMNNVTRGIIVTQDGSMLSTPIWVIQRLKRGASSGKIIREHTLQGDILEVISESR